MRIGLNEEFIAGVAGVCGPDAVIIGDPEKLEPYGHDQVTDPHYRNMPDMVVRPRTAEEISGILKLANLYGVPVTPRGAGSGLSGGAVPVRGGVVLSLERMNRILEIDTKNLTVTVEPGVVTNEINAALEEHGLFFAGYPMSLESCFVGGNVAENAGGGKAVKYGVTGRYVQGLEVVLPTGEILSLGGKRVKDVTGYNFIGLLTGSEGTLGIFTKIIIRVIPVPRHTVDLFVLFPDTKSAVSAVPRIMVGSGIVPTAIEYMDRLSLETTCRYLNEKLEYGAAGAALLISVDGRSKEQVDLDYESVGDLCTECGALEVYVADNRTTSERVWRIRRNVAEAFMAYSPVQSLEDIVVPFASIPDLLVEIEKLSAEHAILIPCYGHAGDGNIHATPVKDPSMSMEEWGRLLDRLLPQLYTRTVALGGTISGEHGIGCKRKKYLGIALSEAEIALMKRVKAAFDPNGILNPGKIID